MSSVLPFSGGVGKRAAGCSVSAHSKAVAGFAEPGVAGGARKLPGSYFAEVLAGI